MIGGLVGDIIGGVHTFDAIQTDVPNLSLASTLYAPEASGGASTEVPQLAFTSSYFAPETLFVVSTDVPTINLTLTVYVPETSGGASTLVPNLGLTSTLYAPATELIIRGVPDFILSRSGSTVTVSVSNRDGKDVELFRSNNHNTSFASQTVFTADSYSDTGLSALNYKYKLRFVGRVSGTITAKGKKSISKFTKN